MVRQRCCGGTPGYREMPYLVRCTVQQCLRDSILWFSSKRLGLTVVDKELFAIEHTLYLSTNLFIYLT